MAVKSDLLSLVFTDLVDSTALKTRLGDHQAGGLIARHHERVRRLMRELGGREVDTAGDGFFLTFEAPSAAVTFALRLQQIHDAEPDLPPVRVGVHLGEVSEQPAPAGSTKPTLVEGLAVDLADRIQSVAQPGQVLMSSPVFEAAQQRLKGEEIDREVRWLEHGPYRLKGIRAPVEIAEAGFEGISPLEAPADSEKARRVRSVGRGRRAAPALGLVLLGVLAIWRLWPAPPTQIRSLAVLPLENLSGDPEQEYFAAGMTEAMIMDLARISSLRVISRTSVLRYRETDKSIPEIARELDVDAVLEGTVARERDRVRIAVQLIDARSDHHLWAESYDRDLRGVLALQTQVARAVASEIRLELTPEDEVRLGSDPAVDPRAHEEYLRGRASYSRLTHGDMLRAIEHFEAAVRIDPDYALGYAGLADAYS
jgi:TolB-like protein/class 3 adenylate cyclase